MWFVVALVVVGALLVGFGGRRRPRDVLIDLQVDQSREAPTGAGGKTSAGVSFGPLCGGVGGALVGWLINGALAQLIVGGAVGAALGYLVGKGRERRGLKRLRREIDFHLPLVMESVVMAVEAGADVLGAIRRVVEITAPQTPDVPVDPVTALLRTVLCRTDAGCGLEETLKEVAAESEVIPIRHAFLHLALAHREGGEIIRPLRELGNSTQLYYQETIEEEIAQLPVKATAPLVCTFTGLVICFITVPLLQVRGMTKGAIPERAPSVVAGERGAMTLFLAAVVVPILCLLGTLALDLRAYTVRSGSEQRILDSAVLEGLRGLPREHAAAEMTRRYLTRFGIGSEAGVTSTPHSVGVSLTGIMTLTFPRLFGIEAGVPYTLYARGRSRPVDAFIALDLGRSLAPTPELGDWGEEGTWGAAHYFVDQANRYSPPLDPRRLTARCFNPTLSALKLAAVRAHDYLSAFGDSRVGVGLFPGNGYDVEVLRPFGREDRGQIAFPRYVGREVRTEDCAAAAIEEGWFEHYRFPSDSFRGVNHLSDTMLTAGGEFDPAYLSELTTGEAVWMSPVREETPVSSGWGDFGAVVEAVLGTLLGAPVEIERGGLSGGARRFGVIFTGDLPRVGGARFPSGVVLERLAGVLSRYRALVAEYGARIRMYVVILPPPGTTIDPFERRALRDFFAAHELTGPDAALEIETLFAGDSGALQETIVPAVLLDRGAGGLAR